MDPAAIEREGGAGLGVADPGAPLTDAAGSRIRKMLTRGGLDAKGRASATA